MKIKMLFVVSVVLLVFACKRDQETYVCKPCDLPCDQLVFSKPGRCPHCGMKLIKKALLEQERTQKINEVSLQTGSGSFLVEGGKGKADKAIKVFYYKPENYQPDSKILFVIPGAGRNGDSYRDAWEEESEKHSLIVLSPQYPEQFYGFGAYHLCGMIHPVDLKSSITFIEDTNIAQLDETQFRIEPNLDTASWIFNDFDRVFDLVVASLHSTQSTYDIFGHSAGGHILHRLALFQGNTKADRIIAANPSFYTLPSFDFSFPFGLKGLPANKQSLQQAFNKNLVVFLGEHDNENEKGGTLLRSTTADKQGLHRLARGQYFYEYAKATADTLGFEFNWKLEVVPKTGHNHRKMGDAAGRYLYER